MNPYAHRSLPAVFLFALAVCGCSVGGAPSNQVRPDAGEEIEVDAKVVLPQWGEASPDLAALSDALYVVSPAEIYATTENKVSVYNGTTWNDASGTTLGLGAALHVVSATEIYAPIGNSIRMWDGLEWVVMTGDDPVMVPVSGAPADIHVVGPEEMYAHVTPDGELPRIRMWDGVAWSDMTTPVEGLLPEFHYLSPTSIYAVVGTSVMMYDGLEWMEVIPETTGLAPALHVVGETEIYVAVGSKIQVWDGTALSDVTGELPELRPAFSFAGPQDIHALAGLSVQHWALPAE